MKAAVLIKKGTGEEAFEIREVPNPEIKDPTGVLIKVECFGLNFADVMARNGLYEAAPKMPSILGYEVVGVIQAVGEKADKGLVGKRVVAMTRFGGYAEYAVTPFYACAEIGDMDAGIATTIAVQYMTAYYMTHDSINLHQGDKVMIHAGAGGVGTALIQLCKLKGCEIFANAGSDEKLEFMRDNGADHVLNYRKQDYAVEIPKLTKGEKLQATFNPIAGETYKKDMSLIGAGGKVMLFGASTRVGKNKFFGTLKMLRKMGLLMPIMLVAKSKSVVGVNVLSVADEQPMIVKRCMDNVVKLISEGKLKPHVGARFKHLDIGKAHDYLESRKSVGKVVVYWEDN